ncbi:UDP-N-acetylglucosamine 1-carboxyvinyltransferase [Saccharopolyspora taberi]|uniref:UDP-N-acetylglucosamine 1-carboxyvinyltransferase n=1 Tax=Saccharopolyspora taberi TaxID=60895 RepID=A0ABN3VB38_9PSEU
MSTIVVSGGHPLRGRCTLQGSKNIALHLYAAGLLMPGRLTIHNAPAIVDTGVCAEIVSELGRPVTLGAGTFEVAADTRTGREIRPELGRRIRPTACFAAAVLARRSRVRFPLPGGDQFCDRPVDLHLRAMERSGAQLELLPGGVVDAVLPGGRPRAFAMSMDTPHGPSLGATVTAIFLAVIASGTTVLTDISIEPEVIHIVDCLNRAGADIVLMSERRCVIRGVAELRTVDTVVAPDRLEAGTLALAALITGGEVVLARTGEAVLTPGFADALTRMGAELISGPDGLLVRGGRLSPVDVVTGPHPQFPTGLQPPTTGLLSLVHGRSRIVERVYQRRATHLDGLRAFGADVEELGTATVITGVSELRPAAVAATDIRCCTALLLAALAAKGESRVSGLRHLYRGHGGLIDALNGMGASIMRVNSAEELVRT